MHNANENGCISLDFIDVFRRFRGAKFKLLIAADPALDNISPPVIFAMIDATSAW